MEAEARSILLTALDERARVDISWIEQLIEVGHEIGGAELQIPDDRDATFADFPACS